MSRMSKGKEKLIEANDYDNNDDDDDDDDDDDGKKCTKFAIKTPIKAWVKPIINN